MLNPSSSDSALHLYNYNQHQFTQHEDNHALNKYNNKLKQNMRGSEDFYQDNHVAAELELDDGEYNE